MWTEQDRDKIIEYLGYSLSQGTLSQVQTAMDGITALSMVAIERCQGYIRQLDKIQQEIDDARPYASRSFQSGGASTAQFFRGERLAHSKLEGARYVKLLAETLGLQVQRDIFGSGGGSARLVRS